MEWIIFFCCYIGSTIEPDGKIIIKQDSVDAFGIQWKILPVKGTYLEDNGGDAVMRAELILEHIEKTDTIRAYLHVNGRHVWFRIPEDNLFAGETAKMTQLPHTSEMYAEDN